MVTVPSGRLRASIPLIVTVPSLSPEASIPLNVTVPEEGLVVCVMVDDPFCTVSVTVSVESQPDPSDTLTLIDDAFPRLMYAPPEPPPFVNATELGFPGGVASATAVTVELSRLSSAGVALETARIL